MAVVAATRCVDLTGDDGIEDKMYITVQQNNTVPMSPDELEMERNHMIRELIENGDSPSRAHRVATEWYETRKILDQEMMAAPPRPQTKVMKKETFSEMLKKHIEERKMKEALTKGVKMTPSAMEEVKDETIDETVVEPVNNSETAAREEKEDVKPLVDEPMEEAKKIEDTTTKKKKKKDVQEDHVKPLTKNK